MSMRRSLAVTMMLALACAPMLVAQSENRESNPLGDDDVKAKLLAGPVVGGSLSQHSGGFRMLNDVTCPVFKGGSGGGFLAGVSLEYVPSGSWSIISRFTYESRPGHFTEKLPDAQVLLPDRTTIVTQEVSTTSDIVYRFINAELVYSRHLVSFSRNFHLGISAGPCLGYVMDGRITQVEDLEQPLNATFVNPHDLPTRNNGRRLIFSDNEKIKEMNTLRFSLKGGLNAEIGLFRDDWILYPGIYYDFGLTDVTRTENWNLNSVIFQVELRHAL